MTTSPRDRAAAVAEKVASEHAHTERRRTTPAPGISEWDNHCQCGKKLPWPKVECENTHRAHLADALADALVAGGLVGDGEAREQQAVAWDRGYDRAVDAVEKAILRLAAGLPGDAKRLPNPYREATP
ncbi:hypothetical protein [Nocardioides sp. WS12]|uniref:hypothetical protein n=1 Tax=Nocardioides sp. WS12 TaxID=2486272 RepID=UPI0015FD26D8|nr:hypothetical protein [Nocardioides sp. WS12]